MTAFCRTICLCCFATIFICASVVPNVQVASAQGSSEDYARSESYNRRTQNRLFRDKVQPNWIDADRLWYQVKTAADSHEFVLVDATKKQRHLAFDHTALATKLSKATKRDVKPNRIQIKSLNFEPNQDQCRFRFAGSVWGFDLPSGPLEKLDPKSVTGDLKTVGLKPLDEIRRSTEGGQQTPFCLHNQLDQALELFWVRANGTRRSYGKVKPGESFYQSSYVGHAWIAQDESGKMVAAFVADAWTESAYVNKETTKPRGKEPQKRNRSRRPNRNRSPDGNWMVSLRDHNVQLVQRDSDSVDLTDDGTEANGYGGRVYWSPDSKHFVVMKTIDAIERRINMVDSAPRKSIHGKLKTITYVKPGDELDKSRPVLFSVDQSNPIVVDDTLFDNPFDIGNLSWHADSKSFSFVYNQRGHQVLRVVSVDADSGVARTVVDETSDTFVCYSQKQFLHRLDDTNELIWMSERDGWNHLYLIDQTTGEIKNQITSGQWVVREVESVDEPNRQLWLKVGGIDPEQDPYQVHLIRIDFDGTNLTRITKGDGSHRWRYTDDKRYLIDTYSRIDLPPVTELRRCETGELICELENADASALLATPWQMPERFVAKGRDGETDIYGMIFRPTNFDPKKRYPVLESIYAGPHSAFAPKSFGLHNHIAEMAELGFIVVKLDGMGTSHRSKEFHDVCWQNLGDSGFPDRVAWIKAAAKDRPEMDISRVGIWGGSAGGQSAMRALITHGDFYKAASADCGCHDNRVDKIWWNEQWMGWPIGPHYVEQSNVTQAHRVKGDLMLIWGELDSNVDPASTTQVIDALIKADIDFEQLLVPGAGHGSASHPYAKRRQQDFFVRKLWHREPRH